MVANGRAYRELVKDGIIEFYSDNIYNERANKLEISKEDNNIIFNFINNPKDPSGYGFSIRVCNSGSKYTPFNVCFMRLFNSFQIEEQQEKE